MQAHAHDLRVEVGEEELATHLVERGWMDAPLGDAEKAACAYAQKLTRAPERMSERDVVALREAGHCGTRQIGASMRAGEQVGTLAGLDVFTMPCPVAEGFLASEPDAAELADRTGADYRPAWAEGVDPVAEGVEDLWEVDADFQAACDRLAELNPATATPEQLVDLLHEAGQGSVFPRLSDEELGAIAAEGKLPKRDRWARDVASGRCGLDALFTLAGLLAFTKDQAALDERIRSC